MTDSRERPRGSGVTTVMSARFDIVIRRGVAEVLAEDDGCKAEKAAD